VTHLGESREFKPSAAAGSPLAPVDAVLANGLDHARGSGARQAQMLRYAGFEQTGSVRTYLFNRVVIGQKSTPMVVTAEIPMFLKHHVSIQDGPALCLYVLTLEINKLEAASVDGPNRELTEDDIVAYLATKPQPPAPKGKREKPVDA
jgi:hypothetical protein